MSLETLIADAIRKKIRQELEKEVELACTRLRARLEEMVATTSLQISKQMSMERMGNDLVIRVEMPDDKGEKA